MNYGLLIIVAGITVIVCAIFSIFAVGVMIAEIPSDEHCNALNGGYSIENLRLAEKYFCDYNETGWHFNRTRYREAFGNMENLQV
jgi:hypothetical protein